jgi:O-antigen ligase
MITPGLPGRGDIVSVALAAAVILAVWNIGPSVDVLKWVSISGSLIGAYSLVGGLIAPEHMMYGLNSKKALIGNIQLAGPFAHSNTLGIYCLLSLALIPLIVSVRWRVFHGLILCTAIVASASRTALLVAGALALWWILCRCRSVISVRVAGTALVGACAVTVLVLPLLSWDPRAFTGRAYVWAESLSAWQESRLFGLGINWFTTAIQSSASVAGWGYVRSGHNLVINTLVTSGLVGICVLVLLLLAAMRSTLALDVTSHQIACFGYLIAFLLISTTEAIWILLPNTELFPVVGLVFAVLIVARHDVQTEQLDSRRLSKRRDVHSHNATPSRRRTSTDEHSNADLTIG